LEQELERSGSNNMSRAGSLGFENTQFITSVLFWHADYDSYVVDKDFEEQVGCFQCCKPVSDRDDLYDSDCPICFAPYEITSEIDSGSHQLPTDDHSRPVRMRCDHIVCLLCLRKWASSDNDKCPTCRTDFLSRPDPDETWVEEFREQVEDLASAEQSATKTPEALAMALLETVDGFFNRLPACFRYVIAPSHCENPRNLRTWPQLMLLTPSEFVSEHKSGFDSECMFDASSQAALWCLDLARQRLKAYLRGDQEMFRAVCTNELFAYANAECLTLQYLFVDCMGDLEEDEAHSEAYDSEVDDSENE
jgi:hypothetical protein